MSHSSSSSSSSSYSKIAKRYRAQMKSCNKYKKKSKKKSCKRSARRSYYRARKHMVSAPAADKRWRARLVSRHKKVKRLTHKYHAQMRSCNRKNYYRLVGGTATRCKRSARKLYYRKRKNCYRFGRSWCSPPTKFSLRMFSRRGFSALFAKSNSEEFSGLFGK